jgi:HlyD family secretion protein
VTAINFEEELEIEESPWRGRIITLLVLLVVGAAIAVSIWYFFFRDESLSISRQTEEITVGRGTINQNLSITGTADALLNSSLVFQTSGTISEVNVKVGDQVQQGQVLAVLESDDLANSVQSAQANLRAAQLKLDDLLAGSTVAEYAAAQQAVSSAQATLTKAQNDYDTLIAGGTSADLSAADQAVRAAEAQVATARANRVLLDEGPSAADITAADAAIASAVSSQTAAQNTANSAANSLTSSAAALTNAETAFCAISLPPPVVMPAFCGSRATPISSVDASIMNSALANPHEALEASQVVASNTAYLNAINSKNTADAGLQSAQDAVRSAQARRDALNDGPNAEDVAAADAAVTSAEASLTSAREQLSLLQDGGTDADQSSAAAAVIGAEAALEAALAKRDEALRGAEPNAIAQADAAVDSAALQVVAAQIRLENAQIIAPFAGTVGAVNIKPGEFFGGGAIASADGSGGGAITLLTPDRITLTMSVGETDYRAVKVGQAGGALFDGIPGAIYPFTIQQIGLSPTVTQGVVTYEVTADIIVLGENPRPAPGMNARGQIITDSKQNIIMIPQRAIRIRGTEQVVDVKRDSGTEEVVITTGVTDGENVEILTGLKEGDIVTVVTLRSSESEGEADAEPTLPGGVR